MSPKTDQEASHAKKNILYIEEYQFNLIRQTGIKHKPNIEVRAIQK